MVRIRNAIKGTCFYYVRRAFLVKCLQNVFLGMGFTLNCGKQVRYEVSIQVVVNDII